ncbi:DUF349 domain-containing protein [Brachybacterium huguangmaarense]
MSESQTPAPRPVPRPGAPRPAAPSPAALAGRTPSAPLLPVAPPEPELDEAALAEALAFGAVTADGAITVQDGTQVREIGRVPGTTAPAAPIAPVAEEQPVAEGEGAAEDDTAAAPADETATTPFASAAEAADAATDAEASPVELPAFDRDEVLRPYAVAYLELAAFLDLTEAKLAAPSPTQAELNRLLEQLRKNLKEPKVVGDVPALRARANDLRGRAKELIAAMEAERTAAREAATARRVEFVESIEAIAQEDPSRISWKSAGDTMRQMVPTWKSMQQEDKGLPRATEDELWKRLSAARGAFDRKRKQFFSELDSQHEQAQKVKEELIARAEALQDSTDWGPTVRAYRELMDEWRAAPRGNRKKDDAQWARFKAAQDTFFAARNADLHASDAEQQENLKVKEGLLAEAEALLPATDHKKAAEALRRIQDRWEDAGKVPRADIRRIEDRLRAVERAVKQAEDDEWRRTDPRTKARVEGASSQLHAAIASYEEALEKARRSGDARRIAEAEKALAARQEWLAVIERSARDLG